MISNLTIQGFRAFRELRVDPLRRVNLFVGKNNAGKTSILEATELLASGTISTIQNSLRRRREEIQSQQAGIVELDPFHLFYGHSPRHGSFFQLSGDKKRLVRCELSLSEASPDDREQGALFLENEQAQVTQVPLAPVLRFTSHSERKVLRLSPAGGFRARDLARQLSLFEAAASEETRVNFLGTEAVDHFQLGELWDSLVLTPEEQGVASALRIIESKVERIAFLGEHRRASRSVFVKISGAEGRIPLGSLGDGLTRLLSLALNLFAAKGGYLLVDEIDTGLHYSVMSNMWKLVIETAKRLDIQVFATTHSWDCVEALAEVHERHPALAEEVLLHRIEPGATATVAYTMDEIAIASRGQIEVR